MWATGMAIGAGLSITTAGTETMTGTMAGTGAMTGTMASTGAMTAIRGIRESNDS